MQLNELCFDGNAAEEAGFRPFSYTQLNTYAICARRYYYVYERDIRIPPPIAVVQGKAVHSVLEVAHKNLRDSKAIRLGEAMELHEREWENAEVEGQENEIIAARKVGRQLLRVYLEGPYNDRRPDQVELRWDRDLDEVPLCGVIDLTEADLFGDDTKVWDVKVSSRAWNGTDIVKSPQLALYAWVLSARRVGYIQLVRPRHVNIILRHLTDADLADSLEWVKDTAHAIVNSRVTGNWPRCWRDNPLCSPKYCGFYSICYR